MTASISFRHWQLAVDRDRTALAYSQINQGSASQCGCTDCRNWIEYRDEVFPIEVCTLFDQLGIDLRKESEVSEFEAGMVDPSRGLYCGTYHFLGSVLSGPDPFVETPDGTGCHIECREITQRLKLGFRRTGNGGGQ